MRTYIFFVIALILCSGVTLAGTPFSRTISATPGGEVSVEITAGKLTVTGWDRNEVHIEGELGDNIEDVRVESDGDEIKIKVEIEDRNMPMDEGYATLEIHIPADTKLKLKSVAVEIDVKNIRGEMEIKGVSGNISVSGRSQTIEIESISGKILIEDGADEIKVGSVGGAVSITGGVMTNVDVGSVSGDIRFDGDLNADGNLSIESFRGDVLILIPTDISTRFELSTFSGKLESDFAGMKIPKNKFLPLKKASFATGSGFGTEISIETFSGAIEVRKK